MKPIKVGIIGCGTIAKLRHIPECKQNKHVEIFGVCDKDENRVKRFASLYRTKAYTDYREMLNLSELDAVIICLPHHLHAQVAIKAAEAKKHILVEKPIATNIDDARAIISAAKDNKVKLMVAHNQRFAPSHLNAKKVIESGELGRVYSFQSTFGHNGPEHWSVDGESSFYLKSSKEVFGVLGDLAIHKIDIIQFLLNDKIKDVHGITATLAKSETRFEDNAIISVVMESGIIGTINASWTFPKIDVSTTIYCEKAIIYIESDDKYPLIIKYHNGNSINYKIPNILEYEKIIPGRSQVVKAFIDSILYNTQPIITGNEGLDALKVIIKAKK